MNQQQIIEEIRTQSIPLTGNDDLQALVEAAGDVEIVLLGEASHGTSEFYKLRAELSKRLIQQQGFSFIAVEGDWPSCYEVNRWIKHYPGARDTMSEVMRSFNRWPTWMWANEETEQLAKWLKDYNNSRSEQDKVGFFGLDVYSLWESMEEVIKHLKETGSPELQAAKDAFSCFEPHGREGQNYGMAAAFFSESCEEEVVKLLMELQKKRSQSGRTPSEKEAALSDELNALVAVNAEKYYRAMIRGGPDSWNIRDRHMVEALNRIRGFHGPKAKAIIWEHNTHIGDARATDMADDGMVNVGQLVREQNGSQNVFAIGFGTHRGTVIAADSWGHPLEVMKVPPAVAGSWEDLMHRAGENDKILVFKGMAGDEFHRPIGHRAIGVVYHPEYERGNYVPSIMAERYDAFVFVDESEALHPLEVEVLV